jgi:hypothetical protein
VEDGAARKKSADDLGAQLDQRRVDFLKADLNVCFTFTDVAATGARHWTPGSPEKAIHLTADQVRDFKAELHRLRERFDGLQAER